MRASRIESPFCHGFREDPTKSQIVINDQQGGPVIHFSG
jgi:hypothetical protein